MTTTGAVGGFKGKQEQDDSLQMSREPQLEI